MVCVRYLLGWMTCRVVDGSLLLLFWVCSPAYQLFFIACSRCVCVFGCFLLLLGVVIWRFLILFVVSVEVGVE